MRTILLTIASTLALYAADGNPILRWLVNPAAAATADPALRAILPNVQSVRVDGRYVLVESAGLSLQSLGPLDANVANDREPSPGARKFVFRFPLDSRHGEGNRPRPPAGIVGVFLNGVPFYSPVSAVSYRGQDLWHRDAVAAARTRQSPLLESLLTSGNRHSPLIGFAFDGYPIYGPYGWDRDGTVRRFRSSYRLRAIARRTSLPDGAELSPSQEGPPVSPEFPVGTFAEDYEYAQGAGDLDEYNGRFARTPEYPAGTYAYFLSTNPQNQLMYPYLVGPAYFGHIDVAQPIMPTTAQHAGHVDLTTPTGLEAGHPAPLIFSFRDSRGRKIRFLEKVHEQAVHLLIVSADLSEFAHIHPALQPDDTFAVNHSFSNGGTYWLFVDHTPPGDTRTVSHFCLNVKGAVRAAQPLQPDAEPGLIKTRDGLRVKLTLPSHLQAASDVAFRFDVADAATDLPVSDLEPYLGAWAHIMIVSEDRRNFIHAHPVEDVISSDPWQHTHVAPGPSPFTVSTVTGFRSPGIYRLWVQFQRQAKVITIPYTIKVDPGGQARPASADIPTDAIRVRVSDSGFEPARITADAGKPVVLEFHRDDAQNCMTEVVFPELGIRKRLPPGGTAVVVIPSSGAREYRFACGMNMYRGALEIR